MKAAEIRELKPEELAVRERDTREQMMRLRFQISMGQTEGIKKYRVLKKDLARLMTVRGQVAAEGAK